MIIKQVKEYERKKGTGIFNYRINISKQDNLNSEVAILNLDEYDKIQDNIKQLENQVQNQNSQTDNKIIEYKKQLSNKDNEIEKLKTKIQDLQELKQTLEDMGKILDERDTKQKETIKELDQQHTDQLKESYTKFNEDINKYIALNQLQNQALKNIASLGFMDMIRNKHKNIAKETIKKAIDEKPVYELTKKED